MAAVKIVLKDEREVQVYQDRRWKKRTEKELQEKVQNGEIRRWQWIYD